MRARNTLPHPAPPELCIVTMIVAAILAIAPPSSAGAVPSESGDLSLPSASATPRATPSAAGAPSYQTPGASLNTAPQMHSNAGAPRNGRRDSLGGTSMGTGFSRSPTRGRRPELGRSDGPPQRHYRVRQQSMAPSDTTGMVVSHQTPQHELFSSQDIVV